MHRQIHPKGFGKPALGTWLKGIQQQGVAKVFHQKPLELRLAKGLQITRQPQAHHVVVIARDPGQQPVHLLAVGVLRVQQPCNGLVHHGHDLGDGEAFQIRAAGGLDPVGQCDSLGVVKHRHGHLQRVAAPGECEGVPLHLMRLQAGQVAGGFSQGAHASLGRCFMSLFTLWRLAKTLPPPTSSLWQRCPAPAPAAKSRRPRPRLRPR